MQASPLSAGEVIAGRYEIISHAAQGGMGTVFRARDRREDRLVALKVLSGHAIRAHEVNRFAREARILAALQHRAIVAYIDQGVLPGGVPFLVMEWLEGFDLAAYLQGGRLTPAQAVLLACQAAAALGVAHRLGITHRDVKPSNLFLRHGRLTDVVVLDFGIARRQAGGRTGAVTQTGSVLGTPQYMAPEQARGLREVGPPADVFSLGCVLFECLSGQPPFQAEHQAAVLARILFEEAPPLARLCPQVPERLAALVARMLAKSEVALGCAQFRYAAPTRTGSGLSGFCLIYKRRQRTRLRTDQPWSIVGVAL